MTDGIFHIFCKKAVKGKGFGPNWEDVCIYVELENLKYEKIQLEPNPQTLQMKPVFCPFEVGFTAVGFAPMASWHMLAHRTWHFEKRPITPLRSTIW